MALCKKRRDRSYNRSNKVPQWGWDRVERPIFGGHMFVGQICGAVHNGEGWCVEDRNPTGEICVEGGPSGIVSKVAKSDHHIASIKDDEDLTLSRLDVVGHDIEIDGYVWAYRRRDGKLRYTG